MTGEFFEGPTKAGFADVIIGTAFGDEGKGLETSRRIETGAYNFGVRFNGGANAGHERGDITLNQIPSSIGLVGYNLLANGSLVDPELLLAEVELVKESLGIQITPDNFGISDTAHIVMPHHKILDGIRETSSDAQGSTKKGIAFVAADKSGRRGVRGEYLSWAPDKLSKAALEGLHLANRALREAGKNEIEPDVELERWLAAANMLLPFMVDSIPLLHDALESGQNVLLEGAQAVGLDMDMGIYPLNTSSNVGPGGAINGTGISHQYIRNVVGVAKLPGSRVGGEDGPFPTRVTDADTADRLRGVRGDLDGEYGKVSERPRDLGYPDLAVIRHAVKVAGVTELVLTKLDKVPLFGGQIKVAVAYDVNGERRDTMPNSALKLAACVPIYETFRNWQADISDVREFENLPEEAQTLVKFIEGQLGVPVTTLGVGPHAHQVIKRHKDYSQNGNGSTRSKVRVSA